jgi:hypothetical protein
VGQAEDGRALALSVTFTFNPDGAISYPASEDNLLALQGSMSLIVKALS